MYPPERYYLVEIGAGKPQMEDWARERNPRKKQYNSRKAESEKKVKENEMTDKDYVKLLELVRIEGELERILEGTSTSDPDSLLETLDMLEDSDTYTVLEKQARATTLTDEIRDRLGLWN